MSYAQELYLLHPLAWTHAQDVLAREADMIGQGISRKKRAAFLERECERLIECARISIPESVDAFLVDLTQTDITEGYDAMRERFRRHGFSGTTRTLRNLSRTLDTEVVDLDVGTILAGCSILAEDEFFAAAALRAFGPVIDTLLQHPLSVSAEVAFEQLSQERLLPSEKDRRALALAQAAVREVFEGLGEIDIGSIRDIAYMRGRLMDVDLSDVMSTLLSSGGASYVAELIRASATAQFIQYAGVLTTALQQRIDVLTPERGTISDDASGASPAILDDVKTESPLVTGTAPSPLLSIPEAMTALNVSRSTILRLADSGALERIKVRNRTMVTRKSVDAYMGIT